jgi:hypothetical protein
MSDLSPGTNTRRARTRGGVVTIVTVVGLLAAMGLTWFGLSVNDQVSANYDASSWMWSLTRSEVSRVNGVTGKVDTRQQVKDAQGHLLQISQSDRYLLLRDQNTGKVSALDPATLQITATVDTQQGAGVTIALHDTAAFVIDPVQGVVRQLHPSTLLPIGEPMYFPPGITGGSFDGLGRLWVAIPSEGTVTAITPAPLAPPSGGSGGGAPSLTRTEPVAESSHDLELSALDDGVAVLDQTNGNLTVLRGTEVSKRVLAEAAGGVLPDRSTGKDLVVTVTEGRHVYIISGDAVKEFTVPGTGSNLRPAVAFADRFYIADESNSTIYSFDAAGALLSTIALPAGSGTLNLEVRENHLFVNAPATAAARVIDDKHQVKSVNKFANDILGGDPPPPAPPVTPPPPPVGKPGAPGNVAAAAGDMQVRLSWNRANDGGSKIIKYVVAGNGQTWEVGANQRSLVVTGLVNGQSYTFTVKAVNAKGAGPERKSNPVVPTRDVPDPPTGLKATAQPDGTVVVSWDPANGQGRKIIRYEVTAVESGAGQLIGSPTTTTLTIKDGVLDYGTQYAFTVVAINDAGAGSKASAASPTVTPFNKPAAVGGLTASTDPAVKGTVKVRWTAPASNGRPITGYKVTAGGKSQTVTATSVVLNGFGDGQVVTVTVAAINAAGASPNATTSARTIDKPSVSNVAISGTGYNQFTVKFAYDDGGGNATCKVIVNSAAADVPCSAGANGYTRNGLWPGQAYTVTVEVGNDAQTVTSPAVAVNTPALNGSVVCTVPSYCGPSSTNGEGIWIYSVAHQTSGKGRGDEFAGYTTKAICYTGDTQGTSINATPWGGRQSNQWVKIAYSGDPSYIPYAWFNLAGGADITTLPPC